VSDVESFEERDGESTVRGVLHRPRLPTGDGVVLAHGAGSNCESPVLRAVASAFAARGIAALRIDLPFRQARPKGPPAPAWAARDRDGLRRALAALARRCPGRLMLGGHSYGGRQASMLLADAPDLARGLVLLAYPLHPPGRPERRRTEHLITLRTPTVFVHGTRDPFGLPDELDEALGLMPGPTRLITVRDAGHDLGARTDGGFASTAVTELLALIG
jgi:predicted alpha/beta-hydrolase family hydrolase